MKQRVMVAGGAGYVGSHVSMSLEAAGYDVPVFDNLSTGHPEFLQFGHHAIGDLSGAQELDRIFSSFGITTVMHFAASINVVLIGEPNQAGAEFSWKPQNTDLDTIIRSAWEWEQRKRSFSSS